MYKIAGKTIDFSDDPRFMEDAEFRARFGPVLDFEKHAEMPKSSFALVLDGLIEHRRFPVHNKVACQFSTSYFAKTHTRLHPVFQVVAATHLKKACDLHGIEVPDEVSRLVSDEVLSNTVNLRKLGNDDVVPATAEDQFCKMADWWLNNERHMTLDEKNQKADRLVKEAKALNLEIVNPRILSYTTKEKIGPRFKLAVETRARICDKLDMQDAGVEYREMVRDIGPSMTKEAVERLFVMDEKYGLKDYYTRIPDPYIAVYGLRKEAQDMKKIADDEMALRYKLDSVAAQSPEYIEGLSHDGVQQFRQDPYGTFKSWPKPMQDYMLAKFDRQLKDAENAEAGFQSGVTDAELKLRTKNLRNGEHEWKGVDKLRSKGKHPSVHNVPIAVRAR